LWRGYNILVSAADANPRDPAVGSLWIQRWGTNIGSQSVGFVIDEFGLQLGQLQFEQ
jgi:hypothetical protein